MATRSTIALEFADGTIGQVYAHWDGYLAHNGKMLLEYYSNPFILRDLIDLGSISSLAPTIGTKHAFSHYDNNMTLVEFNNLYGNMTTFYGRDRGESGVDFTVDQSYDEFLSKDYDYEYYYIMNDGVWYVGVSYEDEDTGMVPEQLYVLAEQLAKLTEEV